MLRTNVWILILSLIAAAATGIPGAAQTRKPKSIDKSGKVVHAVDPVNLLPFSLNATAREDGEGVEFRSAQAITPEDRGAISKAWEAVEKKAAENGFDLSGNGWTYEQIVSPVFSEHVLLLFSRDGSYDERSEFSAIIPRQGDEPLHVIPILRLGYSPYFTSQENPVAMAAFNRALASERAQEKPYWLWVSASYAALNGWHAVLPSGQKDQGDDGAAGWIASPSLHAEDDGGAVARFEVDDAPGRFTTWELTYDKSGSLIKVATSRIKPPTLRVVKAKAPKVRVVKAAQ